MLSLRVKPREGWRVFAGEVGVIVLGVLIALGAQQVADAWQWRQTVERTKADLNAQVLDAIISGVERHAVDACLSSRLVDLAGKVAASRGEWKADPYVLPGQNSSSDIVQYAIPPAYRAPGRSFLDDVWEQAKAGGVLTHMSPAEVTRYSVLFKNVSALESLVDYEGDWSSELSFLSFDGQLNASDRARALSIIANLDGANRSILSLARQMVDDAHAMGATMSAKDEQTLDNYLGTQRKFRGACVDRSVAEKLIAPLRPSYAR